MKHVALPGVEPGWVLLQSAESAPGCRPASPGISEEETLELTRQRFEAGVTNNVEVVQAQESLASADLDYINSVFAHNVAKLSLARALGAAAESLPQFLKMP